MKHRYRRIMIAAALVTSGILTAQIPLTWGKRYNAPPDMNDESRAIAVDANGNVFVTGSGFNANGDLDVITVKYDQDGTQMWVRNYDRGIAGNDEGKAIALDASGNVYVTGYSFGATSSGDAVTVKYDNAGNQQWVAFYNSSYNLMDESRSVAVDASGNVFICGYVSDSTFYYNTLTVCYNSAGTQTWAQEYDGPVGGNDELLELVIDNSSNVYVVGTVESDTFDFDIITMKYNSGGTQLWMQSYAGPGGGDFGKAIALDQNNDVLIGGRSGVNGNWFDYVTLKYSNAGVQQWASTYNNGPDGNNRFEDLWDIAADGAGYVYITGQSQSIGGNSATPDIATVKYTPAGSMVWTQRYDGGFNNADDRGYALVLDDTANVYVAGYSKNASNSDFITIKYDSSGVEEFELRFNSQYDRDDKVNAIAVNNGDIYVTGPSANLANDDYMTIRYSYSSVGMYEQPGAAASLTVFPNPFEDILNLRFSEPTTSSSLVTVTDITGRVVSSQAVTPGTKVMQLDLSGLASGSYTVSHSSTAGTTIQRTLVIRK